ncbi:MAG: VTT domain-containing protein [Chloroflexi bacterium]|nr:VTT domain-containing protein [Chloroflexota bacterium]
MDGTPAGLTLQTRMGAELLVQARHGPLLHRAVLRTLLEVFATLALSGLVAFLIFRYHDLLSRLGPWNYLSGFFVELADAATIIIPTPGHAYTFAMAASLNPVLLGLVGGIGASIGELSGYFVGASGRHVMEGKRRYDRFQALTRRWGGAILFFFAALPIPFDVAGLWAGSARYPLWRFLAAITPGKILKVTGIALAGYYSSPWLIKIFG